MCHFEPNLVTLTKQMRSVQQCRCRIDTQHWAVSCTRTQNLLLSLNCHQLYTITRWFKYDRDYLCVNKSQFVLVIFEPPCSFDISLMSRLLQYQLATLNVLNVTSF
jgi:hypothetical protein